MTDSSSYLHVYLHVTVNFFGSEIHTQFNYTDTLPTSVHGINYGIHLSTCTYM